MYCSVFKVPCLIEFLWDSLFIISQISEFVNSFSKIFSVIFLEIIFQCIYCFIQSIPIGFLYSFRRLFYYITDFLFCQVLFSTFSKSFLWLPSLSDDLFIISQNTAICQYDNLFKQQRRFYKLFVPFQHFRISEKNQFPKKVKNSLLFL